MFSRLVRIPACDRRTDGRTEILPQHSPRYAYTSRGKNTPRHLTFTVFVVHFVLNFILDFLFYCLK